MRRVVISGMGILSPIGNSLKENWESIKNGVCGIAPITCFDTQNSKVKVAGELKNCELTDYLPAKEVKRQDRFVCLAMIAAKEAMQDSNLEACEDWDKNRTGTMIATGIGGLVSIEEQHARLMEKGMKGITPFFVPGAISNIAAAKISIEYGLLGPSSCIVTACASGTNAVGESFRMIRDGYQDVMVCGGSESCISELGIGGFSALNALSTHENPARASIPFDKERNGFVMGEGAAVLVLEELEHARKRGAKIYAEVVGYATNSDAYHVTAPSPDGKGAATCMKLAMQDAGIEPADIAYINAHGTSTKMNDSCETLAVKAAFGESAHQLSMSSTKSMTGHLLGASGAVEAVYTALAVYHDFLPPTVNYEIKDENCDLDIVPNMGRKQEITYAMTNSLGFGGHNASLIIKKWS
ncbi:MAG: beta-ketoacyl-ACP synthase II [Eubacteriales bacterium]|nr:beta-ketoacyl-ACP synthase II [Eubacteriales bacterium]